jgi:X-X-X-Leu-X-X-Gly heptad repeat protein
VGISTGICTAQVLLVDRHLSQQLSNFSAAVQQELQQIRQADREAIMGRIRQTASGINDVAGGINQMTSGVDEIKNKMATSSGIDDIKSEMATSSGINEIKDEVDEIKNEIGKMKSE